MLFSVVFGIKNTTKKNRLIVLALEELTEMADLSEESFEGDVDLDTDPDKPRKVRRSRTTFTTFQLHQLER